MGGPFWGCSGGCRSSMWSPWRIPVLQAVLSKTAKNVRPPRLLGRGVRQKWPKMLGHLRWRVPGRPIPSRVCGCIPTAPTTTVGCWPTSTRSWCSSALRSTATSPRRSTASRPDVTWPWRFAEDASLVSISRLWASLGRCSRWRISSSVATFWPSARWSAPVFSER